MWGKTGPKHDWTLNGAEKLLKEATAEEFRLAFSKAIYWETKGWGLARGYDYPEYTRPAPTKEEIDRNHEIVVQRLGMDSMHVKSLKDYRPEIRDCQSPRLNFIALVATFIDYERKRVAYEAQKVQPLRPATTTQDISSYEEQLLHLG